MRCLWDLYFSDLETGVDCSGFVQAIYKMSGIDLPRTMEEQAESGTVVTLDTISAGDLIFYGKSEEGGAVSPAHVAIYTITPDAHPYGKRAVPACYRRGGFYGADHIPP